jgi:hypothetical protein
MSINCDCCSRTAHFDAFTTADPARFACPFCQFEFGLKLQAGSNGKRRAKTVIYHDPRQAALFDLASEGDEAAADELFKRQ